MRVQFSGDESSQLVGMEIAFSMNWWDVIEFRMGWWSWAVKEGGDREKVGVGWGVPKAC